MLLEINRIRNVFSDPWVLFGDFNIILSMGERRGREGPYRDIEEIRSLVNNLNLIDLPFNGRSFTWFDHRPNLVMAI